MAFVALLSGSVVFAGPVLTYQGRILKPDGSPVNTPTSFTISITSPSGNCELWSEPFSSSMSSGDGAFSFVIGAGTRSDAGTKEFKDIFSDGVVIAPNSSCSAGYTKLSSDVLKLKVRFDDGTGAQSLPAMDITAVPFAIEAQKVAGVASENVLRVSDGVAAPLSSTNFSELMALLNGTSSHYSKNNQLKGMTVPTLSEGQVLGWSGGAWAPLTPSGSGLSAVTANAPLSVDSSTASSPIISLSKADASTNGYLSKEDWATFNQKQSKSLAQGNLWVGDSTNTAAAVLPGGDVSMADDGTFSVLKIRQNPVASGTISALDVGKVYRWNGTQLVPSFLNFGDLKTSAGANQLTAACAANQKIQWSVITDTFTCENIGSLNASAITDGTLDSARLPANATRWQDGSSGAVYYNGGNVGIGTGAAPAAKLEISGSSGSTLKIVDGNQGEGKVLTSDSGGQARWTPQAGVWATSVKTTDYTVVSTDKNTFFISNAGMTYTLLSSATAGAGYMVGFKNNAGTGAVTLNPAASESINGKSSYSLAPNGENVVLISDGVNWHSISQSRLKVCLRSTRAFEAMTFNSGGAFPS
ncbi:MAG: hypothetical protein KUL82_10560, partial [Bdellovibrio sp.]|nr:hypothetical protein [Bdellovibrio sp.]